MVAFSVSHRRGLRVLIVAEHASAKFGGEAILPLHYFRVLRARGIEAWLIVHSRTRDELLARFPKDGDRIHFIPDTRLHRAVYRCGKLLPRRFRYFTSGWLMRLLTQLAARRIAKRLIRENRIDVVHQPIPVSPKESSVLHGLGAPVVIGPMNGGMTYPPGFAPSNCGGGSRFMSIARKAAPIVNLLAPGKLRAQVLLVANERTRAALPAGVRGEVITLPENGVDLSLWTDRARIESTGRPVRFVFSGRFEDWKGADMLIEAFWGVRERFAATLDLIGDGTERPRLEAAIRRLGLEDSVKLLGWQPQARAAEIIRDSDVFVLPSLYECGGAVVLEAMASGLPVIAAAWGGPADYLDDSCAVLIPPRNREQLIGDLRDAMLLLAESPELRRQMGRAGRRKVASYDWEQKVDRMLEIYRDASRASAARAGFSSRWRRDIPRPAIAG